MKTSFALLFDMDGVIADTNPAHKETIKKFCDRYDIEVSNEFLEKHIYGRTNKEWIPELFNHQLSAEEVENFGDEKEAMFREYYKDDLKPVPGLLHFLAHMKEEGVPMVVATSAPGENADFILNGLHIRSYFKSVLDSSDVDKGKPEPEVYLKAAASIGFKPEDCVVLEDSLAGVKAGKNAGCKVIGITTTHTREELSNCDLVITDFNTLQVKDLQNLFD